MNTLDLKESNYNYVFYENNKSYWYNGVSKKFFILTKELGEKLERSLLCKKIEDLPEQLLSKLKDADFVLPVYEDELNKIRRYNEDSINKKDYFLVILPTLNCNFNCWYCIQSHIPSVMTEETLCKILRHLDYMVNVEKIQSLHIEWFGGEPFMGYKNAILPISRYAKKLCKEADIPFYNTATTNGFLISPDKYATMKEIMLSGFQITLDGERDLHNKVKYTAGSHSAFDVTLQNIKGYLEYNEDATLRLRINYTHANLTPKVIDQVKEIFPSNLRDRIKVHLKKVWQERVDKSFYGTALEVQKNFSNLGFNVQKLDIVTDFVPCYVSKKYYTAINYNGTLIKCTASDDLYSEKPLGCIKSDGSLEWMPGVEKRCLTPSFENKRCLECKYLPMCMGICPRNFERQSRSCKMAAMDIKMEDGILNYTKETYAN